MGNANDRPAAKDKDAPSSPRTTTTSPRPGISTQTPSYTPGISGTASSAYDSLLKFAVLGDLGSGKTSLVIRFADGSYNANSIPQMTSKERKIVDETGRRVVFQINDPFSGDWFKSFTPQIKDAHAALIVFDLMDTRSWDNVPKWLQEVDNSCPKGCLKLLVGNKVDLDPKDFTSVKVKTQIPVDRKVIQKFCKEKGLECEFVSAKQGTGVTEAFSKAARQCIEGRNFASHAKGQ